MMIKIKFDKMDYLQLLNNINQLPNNIDKLEEDNAVFLSGSAEIFESILDVLSNNLMEFGIDKNDNINSIGLTIERLIDIISDKLWC